MDRSLKAGSWEKAIGRQLKGMKTLIIGFGKIGRLVADLLSPMEVEIIVFDPYSSDAIDYEVVDELAQALSMVDAVSLHASGERQILGTEEFKRMKQGIYLLNAGRGNLIDEEALLGAIHDGIVAGAWIDTFQDEPYRGPLRQCENVILTPHIGSYTHEGRKQMEIEAVRNLIKGLESVDSQENENR